MPMTEEKIISVCEEMAAVIKAEAKARGLVKFKPKRYDDPSYSFASKAEHLLFMCEEIPRLLPRREKAMRWLGWVQGVLFQMDLLSLAELKRLNMPEGEIVSSDD